MTANKKQKNTLYIRLIAFIIIAITAFLIIFPVLRKTNAIEKELQILSSDEDSHYLYNLNGSDYLGRIFTDKYILIYINENYDARIESISVTRSGLWGWKIESHGEFQMKDQEISNKYKYETSKEYLDLLNNAFEENRINIDDIEKQNKTARDYLAIIDQDGDGKMPTENSINTDSISESESFAEKQIESLNHISDSDYRATISTLEMYINSPITENSEIDKNVDIFYHSGADIYKYEIYTDADLKSRNDDDVKEHFQSNQYRYKEVDRLEVIDVRESEKGELFIAVNQVISGSEEYPNTYLYVLSHDENSDNYTLSNLIILNGFG